MSIRASLVLSNSFVCHKSAAKWFSCAESGCGNRVSLVNAHFFKTKLQCNVSKPIRLGEPIAGLWLFDQTTLAQPPRNHHQSGQLVWVAIKARPRQPRPRRRNGAAWDGSWIRVPAQDYIISSAVVGAFMIMKLSHRRVAAEIVP